MCVHGRVRGAHHSTHIHLGAAALGGVPAFECITGACGGRHGSVWAAIGNRSGCFCRFAAVAVEGERVRVHGPVGVEGDVAGHGLTEVVLRASVPGRVPALECVSCTGWGCGADDLGTVLHLLRIHGGTSSRIKRHGVGLDSPVCIDSSVRGAHGCCRRDLAAAVLGCVPALERVACSCGCRQCAVLAAVLHCSGCFCRPAAVAIEGECVRVHRPVGIHGGVRGAHGSGRSNFCAAVFSGIPAGECVSCAGWSRQCAVLVPVLHCSGCFGGVSSVAVEGERVRVHGPVGVEGDVAGHVLVEVIPCAAVFSGVPALERIARAGRGGRLRRSCSDTNILRLNTRAAIRIERHNMGLCRVMRCGLAV